MRHEQGYFEETRLGKAYDLKLLRRLYPFTRPHRRLLLWSVGLVFLITLVDVALPYITKEAIDRYIVPPAEPVSGQRIVQVDLGDPIKAAIVGKRFPEARIEGAIARVPYDALAALEPRELAQLRRGDARGLALLTGLFLALALVDFLLNFGQAVVMEVSGQRIMHDLRLRLYAHIQELELEFFTRNPVGRLVTRMTSDVQNMYELFTSFVSFVFKDLALVGGIAAVMLTLNWRLALVTFVVIPVVALAAHRFAWRARDIFRTLRVQVAEINTRFAETIGGMRVLQLFGQESANFQRFERLNHANYLSGMEQIRVLALFMPLIEVLALVAVASIIWYGGGRVLDENLSLGALVAFISYIRMFFRPLRDLADKYNILQNAMASAERIILVLDTTAARPTPPAAGSPDLLSIEELRFEEVDFAYLPGEPVLRRLSFRLRQGETVAVVGPTGAGKTSLIHLIPRLYDPLAGRVLINGRDLRAMPSALFRDRMALVMQDPFLFSGSLRENIFEGLPAPDPDRTSKVIAAANLEHLVNRLPQGVDTPLGESGGSLSSGERQLIAIARAFARNPQVLLLDEATSFIDSQTEQWIQQALERLMRRRTVLVVAHRLSTVRSADRILVMNRGRIIESGSHAALMAARGFYFRLHQLQPPAAP
jgi:ATP-binding cassette subfamily B protein